MDEKGQATSCRLPMGFSFTHRPDWAVQKTQFGLILTPPTPLDNNSCVDESYLIMSEASPDILGLDDPRIGDYLDDLVSSQMPSLIRSPDVKSINSAHGQGRLFTWLSKPDSNEKIIAQAYLCISGGSAVVLLAIGPGESIASRSETLQDIFASFGYNEPAEAVPLGMWLHEDHYRTGEYISSWHRLVDFQSDGTFIEQSKYSSDLSNGHVLDVHDATAVGQAFEQSSQAGVWQIEDGVLNMTFADGAINAYDFRIEGHKPKRSMLLKTPDGVRELWQETA